MKTVSIANVSDVQKVLSELSLSLRNDEKARIVTYSFLWKPFIRAKNWLTRADVLHLLYLTDLEIITDGRTGLQHYYIVRRKPESYSDREYSVSVIIPAKNEAGTIRQIITRMPRLGRSMELIFVVGRSTDDTYEQVEKAHKEFKRMWNIRIIDQAIGTGKGDAVRRGFSKATGEILMIFDADMSMDPEELPKFYHALRLKKGELVMGNRLIYPLEKDSMRLLNIMGNKFFAVLFTWLLNQPIKDTLCGTKALFRSDYQKLAKLRSYFGNGDPFGDFDLIFGAAKLNMKILEIPIHYKARVYGRTNIRRFKNGLQLLKMSFTAAVKIKYGK